MSRGDLPSRPRKKCPLAERADYFTNGRRSDQVPRLARGPAEERVRLRVADDFFLRRVPAQLPAGAVSDVAEVAHERRLVADLDVGDRPLPRPHALDEILGVQVGPVLGRRLLAR